MEAHCNRIMLSPAVYFGVEGSPTTELKRCLDAAQVPDVECLDVANVLVIYLLLWLRRVLQDAVLFACDWFACWVVKGAVFQNIEFIMFQ